MEIEGGISWSQECLESLGCISASNGIWCISEELDYSLWVVLCASIRWKPHGTGVSLWWMAATASAKLTLVPIIHEVMREINTRKAFLEDVLDLTVLSIYYLASIFFSGEDSEQFIQLPSCSVYGKFQVKKSKTCFWWQVRTVKGAFPFAGCSSGAQAAPCRGESWFCSPEDAEHKLCGAARSSCSDVRVRLLPAPWPRRTARSCCGILRRAVLRAWKGHAGAFTQLGVLLVLNAAGSFSPPRALPLPGLFSAEPASPAVRSCGRWQQGGDFGFWNSSSTRAGLGFSPVGSKKIPWKEN